VQKLHTFTSEVFDLRIDEVLPDFEWAIPDFDP